MKKISTEELLRELQITITNNVTSKINNQPEGRFRRDRKISQLKEEIISRATNKK